LSYRSGLSSALCCAGRRGISITSRLFAFPEEVRVLERLLNRVVLTLLTIGLGGISVALLTSEGGPEVAGIKVRIFGMLGWATAAFATLLLLRILLGVLRSERDFERS
jgi:hypothetical protein